MEKLANISQFESLMNSSNDNEQSSYRLWPMFGSLASEAVVHSMLSHGYSPLQALVGCAGAGLASYGGAKLIHKIGEKIRERAKRKITSNQRTTIENGVGWDKIKKAAIPLITTAALHGVPNAAHLNTLPAPEIPSIERHQTLRPAVQEAGTDLYRSEQPWNYRTYRNFLKTRFGKDYKQTLNPKEIEFLRDNREQNASFRELMKGLRERQAKHAQEEKELEQIYSGKRPYPNVVDEHFQRKVLEYGKPIR